MKKFIPFLLISILFMQRTNAQNDGVFGKFRVGLKANPIISWATPQDAKMFESNGAGMRFGYGLIVEYKLSNSIGFLTGMEFNAYGSKLNVNDTTMFYTPEEANPGAGETIVYLPSERRLTFNYFEIPLGLRMRTPEINGLTYFGNFGFNLGFRGNKGVSTDNGILRTDRITVVNSVPVREVSRVQQERPDVNIKEEMGLFRLALNVGVGAEYRLVKDGSTSLLFSVNYLNGFSNIFRSTAQDVYVVKSNVSQQAKQNVRVNAIQINIGVLF